MICFSPDQFLNAARCKNAVRYAMIILNRPINADKELIEGLWRHAKIRVTVDGGTNRWLDWLRKHNLQDKLPPPELITGDLDSCRKESRAFFNTSTIIETPDQDATDFTKSLQVLEPYILELSLDSIVAVCETSGRIDQIHANENTLYKSSLKPQASRPVFMLSTNSLSWLIPPGNHSIIVPKEYRRFWCSLVPFEPTKVTTNGLKWNLTDSITKFGGMVSSSNSYDPDSEVVEITTDKPLLWSMGTSDNDD